MRCRQSQNDAASLANYFKRAILDQGRVRDCDRTSSIHPVFSQRERLATGLPGSFGSKRIRHDFGALSDPIPNVEGSSKNSRSIRGSTRPMGLSGPAARRAPMAWIGGFDRKRMAGR